MLGVKMNGDEIIKRPKQTSPQDFITFMLLLMPIEKIERARERRMVSDACKPRIVDQWHQ